MKIRESFKAIADMAARFRREGLPKPEYLVKRGILTRESIAFQEGRDPKEPALEYEIDDQGIREESVRDLERDHSERIAALKGRLQAPSRKARDDFRTADQSRNRDLER